MFSPNSAYVAQNTLSYRLAQEFFELDLDMNMGRYVADYISAFYLDAAEQKEVTEKSMKFVMDNVGMLKHIITLFPTIQGRWIVQCAMEGKPVDSLVDHAAGAPITIQEEDEYQGSGADSSSGTKRVYEDESEDRDEDDDEDNVDVIHLRKHHRMLSALDRSKIPLKDFQKADVLALRRRRGKVLCYDTGNGKTLTAVTASQDQLDRGVVRKVVVLAPASLLHNFREGMQSYGIDPYDKRYELMTYHRFANIIKKRADIEEDDDGDDKDDEDYVDESFSLDGCMLICDEAHHLRTCVYSNLRGKLKVWALRVQRIEEEKRTEEDKNVIRNFEKLRKAITRVVSHSGDITREFAALGVNVDRIAPRSLLIVRESLKAKKVLLLTATPCYNEPYDTANLISMVHGKHVISRTTFKHMAHSSRSLAQSIEGAFSFQSVADNDPAFPRMIERTERIVMDQEYYRRYHAAELQQEESVAEPWTFYCGVRQACLSLPNNPKVRWAVQQILTRIENGHFTLVFSEFIGHGIEQVQKVLKDMGIAFREIRGDTPLDKRSEAVLDCNEGRSLILFVTNAGGEGLDLKGLRCIILMEREWNSPRERQVVGRGRRRHSHTHLPVSEQLVEVYRLMLVKPAERVPGDNHFSADTILFQKIEAKDHDIEPFVARLKALS